MARRPHPSSKPAQRPPGGGVKVVKRRGGDEPDTTKIRQFGTIRGMLPVWGWTVEALVGALDAHNAGNFALSGRLAEDMRAHPWIRHGLDGRGEVHSTCPLHFSAAGRWVERGGTRQWVEDPRSRRCRDFVRELWPQLFPLATMRDLQDSELLNGHGVWAQDWEELRDGRDRWWVPTIKPWEPTLLAYRQYQDPDSVDGGAYIATTLSHGLLKVEPGRGRWGIFARRTLRPWMGGVVRVLGESFCGDGYNFRDNMTHQDRWGRGIVKLQYPNGWSQREVNACASSLIEGGGGGVLECPTDAEGKALVNAELLRADGAGWQTFDATEKRVLRRVLIALLRQDMTTTGTTGIADNDPRQMSLWKCREADVLTYYDASVEVVWEEVGGVRCPVPIWGPADGPIRRQVTSWIAQFNFGDAALAPHVWRDGTPPDLFERHLDAAAKRGSSRAAAARDLGTALKSGLQADYDYLAEQCGLSLWRPALVQPGGRPGGALPPISRDDRLLTTDVLDGVQVRISGVGQPFHAGHGPGVGPGGGHGHLTAGEAARKAATDAAEAKHRAEFIAHHEAQAAHHAEHAGTHAGLAAHLRAVGGGAVGEDGASAAAIAHHAAQSAHHAAEAKASADQAGTAAAHGHAETAAAHADQAHQDLVLHHVGQAEHHSDQAYAAKHAAQASKTVEEAQGYAAKASGHAASAWGHHRAVGDLAGEESKHAGNTYTSVRVAESATKDARAAVEKVRAAHEAAKAQAVSHAEDAAHHLAESEKYLKLTASATSVAEAKEAAAQAANHAAVAKVSASKAEATEAKTWHVANAKMSADYAKLNAVEAATHVRKMETAAEAKPVPAGKGKRLTDVHVPNSVYDHAAMGKFARDVFDHRDAPFYLKLYARPLVDHYSSGGSAGSVDTLNVRLVRAFEEHQRGRDVPEEYMRAAKAKKVVSDEHSFVSGSSVVGHYVDRATNVDLPPAVLAAANWYTYHGDAHMNRLLRGHENRDGKAGEQAAADMIPHLDAYTRANRMDHDVVVYRGMTLPAAQASKFADPGGRFVDRGFTSTSTSMQTATAFTEGAAKAGHVKMLVHVEVPRGSHAAYVTPHSHYKHESEFLLARGTTFHTTRVSYEGDVTHVHVRAETRATYPRAPKVPGPRVDDSRVVNSAAFP